jgi:hypothetical protein
MYWDTLETFTVLHLNELVTVLSYISLRVMENRNWKI